MEICRQEFLAMLKYVRLGFAALFANSFQTVMLLHGLAVLCGYIIPGHIANREFKKFKRSVND